MVCFGNILGHCCVYENSTAIWLEMRGAYRQRREARGVTPSYNRGQSRTLAGLESIFPTGRRTREFEVLAQQATVVRVHPQLSEASSSIIVLNPYIIPQKWLEI